MPTLVTAGSHDPGTPLVCSHALVAGIPSAQLVVVEDSARITNVERPREFTEALCMFLRTRAIL
ncbi:MAG: alpha/beta fold hydrolase [Hyphomicrobiaceae bacterium]